MMKLIGLGIMVCAILNKGPLPSCAVADWKSGKPYDVGQPIGLDAKEEKAIIGLVVKVSPSQITVCGKEIAITSVEVNNLTNDDFLAKYSFTPNLIGFREGSLVEILINKLRFTRACGEFADPGTHLFISKGHAVMEVANDYFELKK